MCALVESRVTAPVRGYEAASRDSRAAINFEPPIRVRKGNELGYRKVRAFARPGPSSPIENHSCSVLVLQQSSHTERGFNSFPSDFIPDQWATPDLARMSQTVGKVKPLNLSSQLYV